MQHSPKDGITRRVARNSNMVLVCTCSWIALILFFNMVCNIHSRAFVDRVGQSGQVKTLVNETIPDEMYQITIGRKAVSDDMVQHYREYLNMQMESLHKNNDTGKVEHSVIVRMLDNYLDYCQQLVDNVQNHGSVDESMRILQNVRSVGGLIAKTVQDYIQVTVDYEVRNAHIYHIIYDVFMGLELLSIVIVVLYTIRGQRKLTSYIDNGIKTIESFAVEFADGRLDRRIDGTNIRELETLTVKLNQMAEQLSNLIRQVKENQDQLTIAELKTLQAQINPHFLYNSLDTIIWQAEYGNNEAVIRTTTALSDFFRISLNAGEEWITVEREMNHLEGYLVIQQTRYRDILRYEIAIDKEIRNCRMLKLMLQPLVENALYHGIKNKRGGGKITVTGGREGDRLVFRVSDTGRGMTPEQLQSIRESLQAGRKAQVQYGERGSGFGLKNVDLRLRLYYNQAEGLQIESGAEGTTVSFNVPILTDHDKEQTITNTEINEV